MSTMRGYEFDSLMDEATLQYILSRHANKEHFIHLGRHLEMGVPVWICLRKVIEDKETEHLLFEALSRYGDFHIPTEQEIVKYLGQSNSPGYAQRLIYSHHMLINDHSVGIVMNYVLKYDKGNRLRWHGVTQSIPIPL